MTKPYPIIHLTQPADHERLVRELYALGYVYSNRDNVEESVRCYRRDTVSIRDGRQTYPWLAIEMGGVVNAFTQIDHPMEPHTRVNSIGHFLDYAKRLGPPEVLEDEDDMAANAFDEGV